MVFLVSVSTDRTGREETWFLPAPRLVGRKAAKPTILNLVPQILDVT